MEGQGQILEQGGVQSLGFTNICQANLKLILQNK